MSEVRGLVTESFEVLSLVTEECRWIEGSGFRPPAHQLPSHLSLARCPLHFRPPQNRGVALRGSEVPPAPALSWLSGTGRAARSFRLLGSPTWTSFAINSGTEMRGNRKREENEHARLPCQVPVEREDTHLVVGWVQSQSSGQIS